MMPRSPSNDENGLKKGPWTPEEDRKLVDYIEKNGHGSWRALPKLAGLNRCGKSCRLRWTNYLRPDIKRGKFTDEEEQIIINLHAALGNKWSMIASHLPGRTDNEIKNFWNTHLKKKLLQMGIDPVTHMPRTELNIFSDLQQLLSIANFSNLTRSSWENSIMLHSEATQFARNQLVQNIMQLLNPSASASNMEAIYNLFAIQPISELQGFSNLPIGSSSQIHSNFPNPESSKQPLTCDGYQTVMDGLKSFTGLENGNDPVRSLFDMNPSLDLLPNLVPVSPECSNKINQAMEINKSGEIFLNPLSKSAAFEDNWCDLMDDEATGSYWKDVINQMSPQPWKIL